MIQNLNYCRTVDTNFDWIFTQNYCVGIMNICFYHQDIFKIHIITWIKLILNSMWRDLITNQCNMSLFTHKTTPLLQDGLPQANHKIEFLTAMMYLMLCPQKMNLYKYHRTIHLNINICIYIKIATNTSDTFYCVD